MVKQTSKSKQLSTKTAGKRTNASTRSGTNSRRAVASKVPAKKTLAKAPAAVAGVMDVDTQRGKDIRAYGEAVKLLNAGKYADARSLLSELLDAPTMEVAHTARMRLLMFPAKSNITPDSNG